MEQDRKNMDSSQHFDPSPSYNHQPGLSHPGNASLMPLPTSVKGVMFQSSDPREDPPLLTPSGQGQPQMPSTTTSQGKGLGLSFSRTEIGHLIQEVDGIRQVHKPSQEQMSAFISPTAPPSTPILDAVRFQNKVEQMGYLMRKQTYSSPYSPTTQEIPYSPNIHPQDGMPISPPPFQQYAVKAPEQEPDVATEEDLDEGSEEKPNETPEEAMNKILRGLDSKRPEEPCLPLLLAFIETLTDEFPSPFNSPIFDENCQGFAKVEVKSVFITDFSQNPVSSQKFSEEQLQRIEPQKYQLLPIHNVTWGIDRSSGQHLELDGECTELEPAQIELDCQILTRKYPKGFWEKVIDDEGQLWIRNYPEDWTRATNNDSTTYGTYRVEKDKLIVWEYMAMARISCEGKVWGYIECSVHKDRYSRESDPSWKNVVQALRLKMFNHVDTILSPQAQLQAQLQQKHQKPQDPVRNTAQLVQGPQHTMNAQPTHSPPRNHPTPNLSSMQQFAQPTQPIPIDPRLTPSLGAPQQQMQHPAGPSGYRQTPSLDSSQQWSRLPQPGPPKHRQNPSLDTSKQWGQLLHQVPIDPRLDLNVGASQQWAPQQNQPSTPSTQSQISQTPMASHAPAPQTPGQSNGFNPGNGLYVPAGPRNLNNGTIPMQKTSPLVAVQSEKKKRGRKPKDKNAPKEQTNQPSSQHSSHPSEVVVSSPPAAGDKRKVSAGTTKATKRHKSMSLSPKTYSRDPQEFEVVQDLAFQSGPYFAISPPPRTHEELEIPFPLSFNPVGLVTWLQTTMTHAKNGREARIRDLQGSNIDPQLAEQYRQDIPYLAKWEEYCLEIINRKCQELEIAGNQAQLQNLKQGVIRRQPADKEELGSLQNNSAQNSGQYTPNATLQSKQETEMEHNRRSAEIERLCNNGFHLAQVPPLVANLAPDWQNPGMQQQSTFRNRYNNGVVAQSPPTMVRPRTNVHDPDRQQPSVFASSYNNNNMGQGPPMVVQPGEHRQNVAIQHPSSYNNIPPMVAQQGAHMQHPSGQRPSFHVREDSYNMGQGAPMNGQLGMHMQHQVAPNSFSNNGMHAWGQGPVIAGPQGMPFPNHGMHTLSNQQTMNVQLQQQQYTWRQNQQRAQMRPAQPNMQMQADQGLNQSASHGHGHDAPFHHDSGYSRKNVDPEAWERARAKIMDMMGK